MPIIQIQLHFVVLFCILLSPSLTLSVKLCPRFNSSLVGRDNNEKSQINEIGLQFCVLDSRMVIFLRRPTDAGDISILCSVAIGIRDLSNRLSVKTSSTGKSIILQYLKLLQHLQVSKNHMLFKLPYLSCTQQIELIIAQ